MDIVFSSTTTHVGGMRCQSRFESSGITFATDVAASLGGQGINPSPGEMLACCVASCMLSMIAYTGARKGFETEGVTILAGYESGTGGISALLFDITVPMQTTPVVRRMMEAAVKNCPVGAALSAQVEKRVDWHWAE